MKSKIFLFLIFLCVSSLANAFTIDDISFEQEHHKLKYYVLVKDLVNYVNSYVKDEKIEVQVKSYENTKKNPYTVFKSDGTCSVNIILRKKPIIFNSMEKEFEFLFLHELGHCILGNRIFYTSSIDWDKRLLVKDINKSIYERGAEDFKKCSKCVKHNILISYTELFADVFAINYYLEKPQENADLITYIYNHRLQLADKIGIENNYLSYFYIEHLILNGELSNKSLDEMIYLSQKVILDYEKRHRNILTKP